MNRQVIITSGILLGCIVLLLVGWSVIRHSNPQAGIANSIVNSDEAISEDGYLFVGGGFYYFSKGKRLSSEIPWITPAEYRYVGQPENTYGKYMFANEEKVVVVTPEGGEDNTDFTLHEATVADPTTFELFGTRNLYAKDSKKVYINRSLVSENARFEFEEVEEAQPKTFEIISLPGDEQYCKGRERCGRSLYATDGKYIFYGARMLEGKPNTETFRVLPFGPYELNYATDGRNVYFMSRIIEGADLETFESLVLQPYEGCGQDVYSKDKNNVYYADRLVEGADPLTFEVVRDEYGKDKNQYYRSGDPVDIGPNDSALVCEYG